MREGFDLWIERSLVTLVAFRVCWRSFRRYTSPFYIRLSAVYVHRRCVCLSCGRNGVMKLDVFVELDIYDVKRISLD